eukprot:6401150-Prymnesium_polylepis.1
MSSDIYAIWGTVRGPKLEEYKTNASPAQRGIVSTSLRSPFSSCRCIKGGHVSVKTSALPH